MPRIKAVLFDKDGVLVDFNRTWGPAARRVVARLCNGDEDRLAALSREVGFLPGGDDLSESSIFVTDPTPVYGPRWADIIGRTGDEAFFVELDRMFAEAALESLMPIVAAEAALARLHARGLPMGLATNDAEANARLQLARLGFDRFLPFVAGYDSGHGAKPSPGMVTAFARHARVAPSEVALVGDTLHDLHAARAAGAVAVAALTGLAGGKARDRLAPHADLIIASLTELEAAVDAF